MKEVCESPPVAANYTYDATQGQWFEIGMPICPNPMKSDILIKNNNQNIDISIINDYHWCAQQCQY